MSPNDAQLACPHCQQPLRRTTLWSLKFWRPFICPHCKEGLALVRPFGQQILVMLLCVALSQGLSELMQHDFPKWMPWILTASVAIAVDALLIVRTSGVRKIYRRLRD